MEEIFQIAKIIPSVSFIRNPLWRRAWPYGLSSAEQEPVKQLEAYPRGECHSEECCDSQNRDEKILHVRSSMRGTRCDVIWISW